MDFGGTDDARDRRRQSDAIRTGAKAELYMFNIMQCILSWMV